MSDLTPEQTDAVRRALRAARHDAPLPDTVAARLDDRLAELAAERTSGMPAEPDAPGDPAETTVVPLRRRRWPAVLAAAAAVTAIGLAGTQLFEPRGESDSLTSAESAADGEAAQPPVAGAESYDLGLGGPLTASQRRALGDAGFTRLQQLRSDRATLDSCATCSATDETAPKAEKSADGRAEGEADARHRKLSDSTVFAAAATCADVVPAHIRATSTVYGALYEEQPVALVVFPDAEGAAARAWPCDGGRPFTVRLD